MQASLSIPALVAVTALATFSSCGGDDAAASTFTTAVGLGPLDPGPNFTMARAELGQKLFFDKRLSSDGTMACQSCHQHDKGWSNGEAGSTKVGGNKNTKNSPTLYNVGYLDKYYWDGRAATIEANISAAWKGHMREGADDEMNYVNALKEIPAYKEAFDAEFTDGVTGQNIVHSLASFVRTLQSGDAPYDRYANGDKSAMSEDAVKGMELFNGKARCNQCHTAPLFTDRGFHNIGIGDEPGRGAHDTDPKFQGAFKTPGLRSVAKSGPYFHDGSVATLREAVKLMTRGGNANPNRDPILKDMPEFSDAEIDQLMAFLESLTSSETFAAPKLPE